MWKNLAKCLRHRHPFCFPYYRWHHYDLLWLLFLFLLSPVTPDALGEGLWVLRRSRRSLGGSLVSLSILIENAPTNGTQFGLRPWLRQSLRDCSYLWVVNHAAGWMLLLSRFSHIRLVATPWTAAHQAPPSLGFSRQEYWSGETFPSPRDIPDPGIKPRLALQADSLLYAVVAAAAAAKSLQSCPTLCDPIDGSPPGSPVPGILQARTLEWVATRKA